MIMSEHTDNDISSSPESYEIEDFTKFWQPIVLANCAAVKKNSTTELVAFPVFCQYDHLAQPVCLAHLYISIWLTGAP